MCSLNKKRPKVLATPVAKNKQDAGTPFADHSIPPVGHPVNRCLSPHLHVTTTLAELETEALGRIFLALAAMDHAEVTGDRQLYLLARRRYLLAQSLWYGLVRQNGGGR